MEIFHDHEDTESDFWEDAEENILHETQLTDLEQEELAELTDNLKNADEGDWLGDFVHDYILNNASEEGLPTLLQYFENTETNNPKAVIDGIYQALEQPSLISPQSLRDLEYISNSLSVHLYNEQNKIIDALYNRGAEQEELSTDQIEELNNRACAINALNIKAHGTASKVYSILESKGETQTPEKAIDETVPDIGLF